MKRRFGKKPLSAAQIAVLKKQEEPECDLVLEIMSATEFGTSQKSVPKEALAVFERTTGHRKDHGHFLPLKKYDSVFSQLRSTGLKVREIPNEVMRHFNSSQNTPQTTNFDDIQKRLPSALRTKLKDFQKDGFLFGIQHEGRCLIADEMGLGKTLQAISIASYYQREWPLLVICPSSVRHNWKDEILKNNPLCGSVNVILSSNDLSMPFGDVTIVTYEIASKHAELFIKKNFQVIVVDECHYLKNPQSKRCRELLPVLLNSKRTVLLSGTALLSRPCELYPQLQALRFPIFDSFHKFAVRYCKARVGPFGWDYTGNSHLAELHVLLSNNVMIRRLKDDVLKDAIPEKERMTVEIAIPEEEAQRMQSIRDAAELARRKVGGEFDKLQKQAQFLEFYVMSSKAKVVGVCKFIEKMILEGTKFLVFAHHQEMLDAIEEFVKSKDIGYIRIDGATQPTVRSKYVDKFQKNRNMKIAILSVTAAGTGITLHAADTVVFAELYWTPGILRQAEDRVHRIGQKNKVRIFYLIGKKTVDDYIWPLLEKKLYITGEALDGKESGHDAMDVEVNVEVEKTEELEDDIIDCDEDMNEQEKEEKESFRKKSKTVDLENSSELLDEAVFDIARKKTKTTITVKDYGKKKSEGSLPQMGVLEMKKNKSSGTLEKGSGSIEKFLVLGKQGKSGSVEGYHVMDETSKQSNETSKNKVDDLNELYTFQKFDEFQKKHENEKVEKMELIEKDDHQHKMEDVGCEDLSNIENDGAIEDERPILVEPLKYDKLMKTSKVVKVDVPQYEEKSHSTEKKKGNKETKFDPNAPKLKASNGKPLMLMESVLREEKKKKKSLNDYFKVTKPMSSALKKFGAEKVKDPSVLTESAIESVLNELDEISLMNKAQLKEKENKSSKTKACAETMPSKVAKESVSGKCLVKALEQMPPNIKFFDLTAQTHKTLNTTKPKKEDFLLERADNTIKASENVFDDSVCKPVLKAQTKQTEVIEISDDESFNVHPQHEFQESKANSDTTTSMNKSEPKQVVNLEKKCVEIKLTKYQKETLGTRMGDTDVKRKKTPTKTLNEYFKEKKEGTKPRSEKKRSVVSIVPKLGKALELDELDLEPNEFEGLMSGFGKSGKMVFKALGPK
ncbi:chromodomain-helicase-DNA-binding protein, putative [Entamoeba invadens IP1]|uniref:Chromodomain-helicase-DNA-binding protein, putative n=1 Tax=Entamoeba invadens IP1 TaxID=370355 RepID=A0A0A1UAH4_ENTIV|nr:chromodomain-helicase-DNA-binding protein, putative [Entamoeba invadens IP1]ELP89188.1 chromodomain-helicase-DNA-binding protein, putative [Entamoeba invadens IP1]|eukprot:XP_004255959.1 chromodomain-helicase-DNA-binding protein, putative [Entamoeba invadens IP1]